jgi:hypothetical protein
MTEAQWKPYLRWLEGQRVDHWSGWVLDVHVTLLGAYEARIDMDPPWASLRVEDVYLPVGQEVGLRLIKGQTIMFSGTIDRVQEFLGSVTIWLRDATLEP